MANRNLESLSLDDVQSLLTNLNMNNYKDSFLRNEIDGETLSAIESATEFADLGINIPAKANLLFKKVSTFKSGGVPIDLLTKVASTMSVRADVDISRNVQVRF